MNPVWIITGIILFGGMAAAGISLYVKKRRESQSSGNLDRAGLGLAGSEKDENQAQK